MAANERKRPLEVSTSEDAAGAVTEAKPPKAKRRRKLDRKERKKLCPYLGTINRAMLDFDFEKVCSVSLSNLNVYACLVCGKYFQGRRRAKAVVSTFTLTICLLGRGPQTHAYFHSLQADHHLFIHLQTEKVYCLPDGYEVDDPSLEDIKRVLNPIFTKEDVQNLDAPKRVIIARGLGGKEYIPGMVGLNNLKVSLLGMSVWFVLSSCVPLQLTDGINVVVQMLAHVGPLRDFFMRPPKKAKALNNPLVRTFSELIRKMWHPRNYKGHVSPHEFVHVSEPRHDD